MKNRIRSSRVISVLVLLCVAVPATLGIMTAKSLQPVPRDLAAVTGALPRPRVLDRYGTALSTTYTPRWNVHDQLPLHRIPDRFQQAVLFSEDRRFYRHDGVDRAARCHALWQNIRAGRVVRGASTITEQVVRMLHPRPRTPWSRWLEGWEAAALEKTNSKSEILWFHLNQVPYASRRRGVAQAARFYFNRDPDTLNLQEMLALTVLIRAPDAYDLRRHPGRWKSPAAALARAMAAQNLISQEVADRLAQTPALSLGRPRLAVQAPHFIRHVLVTAADRPNDPQKANSPSRIHTTLDGPLQTAVQTLLDTALQSLKPLDVANGAALVVRHGTGDILTWAVSGTDDQTNAVNAVTAPRQPGSALKPFVYAMALEKGWTPATPIPDRPLSQSVGRGLHTVKNYSGRYHGWVRLRQALGSSLNIPAVRAVRFIGNDRFLERLRCLGITSLNRHPDIYGDGLALGNGEVSLLELVQAYTALANQGQWTALTPVRTDRPPLKRKIFDDTVTSLISHILSDPEARILEFDRGGVLDMPVQTAVKTGTSSDYRDAWAVGYNAEYTVGVWMGNLDGSPTGGVSGSRGPAGVLRSIFARLNRRSESRSLFMSPRLVQREIPVHIPFCRNKNNANRDKKNEPEIRFKGTRSEWFLPEAVADTACISSWTDTLERDRTPGNSPEPSGRVTILFPPNGLQAAMDPRIPDHLEAMTFEARTTGPAGPLIWSLDGQELNARGTRHVWPLQPGRHTLAVRLNGDGDGISEHRVVFQVRASGLSLSH